MSDIQTLPYKEQIISRLQQDNTWWSTGTVEEEYSFYPKRQYFDLIFPLIRDIINRRAAVIIGQKGVGKTVLALQSINALIKKGVSPHQIVYINFNNQIFRGLKLKTLFEISREISNNFDKEGWYIIFDNLEYLQNWQNQIENLVDEFPGSKFVAITSAILNNTFDEIGYSRFNIVNVPALTFFEYIHLMGLQHLIVPADTNWNGNLINTFQSSNIALLNTHFIRYINYGAYPEIIFSKKFQKSSDFFLGSENLSKFIPISLALEFGIQNIDDMYELLFYIAINTGKEFSLEKLSSNLENMEKNTIKKYLKFLELTHIIQLGNRLDFNANPYERANYFKIYLTNSTLRSILIGPISSTDIFTESIVETVIHNQWKPVVKSSFTYSGWINGRTQGIVEMIGTMPNNTDEKWVVASKWSNHYYENFFDLKPLFSFCEANYINEALITTIDKSGSKVSNKIKYYFMPAALYAYSVGYNSVLYRK